MKKFPKPWYRPKRGVWYVTLDGKQHNLGPDRDEAFESYKKLLSQPQRRVVTSGAVVVVIDLYLDWCQMHRRPETYRWYADRLQSFSSAIGAELTVASLRTFHVQQWVDSHPDWSNGSRRNAIASVKRALRWAEEQGHIDRSPIANMKKPACGKREVVITDEQYQAMISGTRDEAFRDLLTVSWETGCRPQESLRVEARHVDLANQRWVIPVTPGKPDNRVVYLTPNALAITRRLILKHPDGPLFRNRDGIPWTTDAVNCRFYRFSAKLGFRCCLYAIRHTWITRMLQKGVDSLTVAFLAGHKDASMLAKHYAHLTLSPQHMLEQAKKAVS